MRPIASVLTVLAVGALAVGCAGPDAQPGAAPPDAAVADPGRAPDLAPGTGPDGTRLPDARASLDAGTPPDAASSLDTAASPETASAPDAAASPETASAPDAAALDATAQDAAALDAAAPDAAALDATAPDAAALDAAAPDVAAPDAAMPDTAAPDADAVLGPDGAGCLDACPAAGAVGCDGQAARICALAGDGCLAWGPAAPCDDGDICTVDVCQAGVGCVVSGKAPGPCEWPGQWSLYGGNPVLSPVAADPDQGADNVYAPDVLKHAGAWWMWYGGQGKDGHDAIFLARSADLVSWSRFPSDADPAPVIDHGAANHVNDPSVVRAGDTFYLYYTEAATAEDDRIHLAVSSDGLSWSKQGRVLDVGPVGSWEADRVGRPAVRHEGGVFQMWYDGQIVGVARHVGYATSPDGVTWTRHPANPVVLHEGALDVERVGPWYVMLAEGGGGTRLYVGTTPTAWQKVGPLFGTSGAAYDAFGQVTPFLLVQDDQPLAIYFGGASSACWCKNRIALATLDGTPLPAPEGCGACLGAFATCEAACQDAGKPGGSCGAPGSTDPAACCACAPDVGCEKCVGSHPSCKAACQANGAKGGYCAVPGSADPGACCACL